MNILGIHRGHDSSVALIKDGEVVFNIEEERLVNIKHCVSLPVKSLESCFESTGLSPKDIDLVAVPELTKISDILLLLGNPVSEVLEIQKDFPRWSDYAIDIATRNLHHAINSFKIYSRFSFPTYQKTYPLSKKAKILQISHHLCHAAGAYFSSGFKEKCLVITSDGSGYALSNTIWLGEYGKLEPILKIGIGGSLGFFYGIVTEGLGWAINEGEGKTMGLAPYGSTEKTKGLLDQFCPKYKNGNLVKPYNFGPPGMWSLNGVDNWHYPQSEVVKKLASKYGRENIAAEAQRVLEREMLSFVIPWIEKLDVKYLCAAGGVFLNVKMNQRIWETGILKDFYIFPDAGDGGLAVSAALYVYHLKNPKWKGTKVTQAYWGTEFSDDYIEKALKVRQLKYKKYRSKDNLVQDVAKLLAKGKIVAWFQGKMETGPRALGNRSILMDPRFAKNKDIINSRVKYREPFRPFCPSMTPEGMKRYVVNTTPHPDFMIISFDAVKSTAKEIPAVVHKDNTLRVQQVTKKANPLYYQLIDMFGKITKVPCLLNTSFNIKGQPIVGTPEEAVKCFYDTGLDYLAIGSFLLKKP